VQNESDPGRNCRPIADQKVAFIVGQIVHHNQAFSDVYTFADAIVAQAEQAYPQAVAWQKTGEPEAELLSDGREHIRSSP
jgi:hypothetical protein